MEPAASASPAAPAAAAGAPHLPADPAAPTGAEAVPTEQGLSPPLIRMSLNNGSCFAGQIIIQWPMEAAAQCVDGAAACAGASIPTQLEAQSEAETRDMEVEEMGEQEDEKMDVD
ncbi:hypothetical protein Y1Q_0006830 [Alligator mississippiensis]|uniref:Uncharacterized protein n=1 Tax=Alligator mississippiensis TaxID=8496 RepID=A0A151M5S1_ALLMI|nr:hypothetical protein Y1Q_0006830 [Alligator mississippiensis]